MTSHLSESRKSKVFPQILLLSCLFLLTACNTSTTLNNIDSTGTTIDITDVIFTERSGDCADYVNTYTASVLDIQNSFGFTADVAITSDGDECTFTSDSVPNHDFNDETAAFAGGEDGATIAETDTVLTVTRFPEIAAEPTPLTQETKNGIFLNGVKLDILSAGCYRPLSADAGEDGNVGIGCSSTDAWLLDPLNTESKFGADAHNAHTQPGGLYHYHGGPNAMYDLEGSSGVSPVIGFAADGFPIYGSFFEDDKGEIREAVSGYTLKTTSRGERTDTNPGGMPTGEYNDDWEFTNAGDLDECNGMTIDGQYGYYVTSSYPWVMGCISGTPHESFGGGDDAGAPTGPPPGDDGAPTGPPV